ncbi:MAG: hypothetical protein EOP04_04570 [Proteobacteria bacterium]|nr:MAG: hypothetical protein EOP04_04570 [Pseudomonadota bacterium]
MTSEKSYVSTLRKVFQIGGIETAGTLTIVDGELGLMVCQMESFFHLSSFLVRRCLQAKNLSYRSLGGEEIIALKEDGILSREIRAGIFVPKTSIEVVLQEIGTHDNINLFYKLFREINSGLTIRPREEREKAVDDRIARLEQIVFGI